MKEPIHERGVFPSVRRTISRSETDPPQKIMTLQIGGSMVKNSPENAVVRAQPDGDQLRSDARHFPGTLPRSLAAVAAGLGVGAPRPANAEKTAGVGPLKLCKTERNDHKMHGPDFGDAIGKELQNLYDDVVAQPVPDRFLNLLNQLEQTMVSSGRSGGAPGERE
jgi:hypothetical protein